MIKAGFSVSPLGCGQYTKVYRIEGSEQVLLLTSDPAKELLWQYQSSREKPSSWLPDIKKVEVGVYTEPLYQHLQKGTKSHDYYLSFLFANRACGAYAVPLLAIAQSALPWQAKKDLAKLVERALLETGKEFGFDLFTDNYLVDKKGRIIFADCFVLY